LTPRSPSLRPPAPRKLFAEKQSGTRSDRPQLRKALAALGEGDVLMVTRLDRLARSTRDLLNVLHEVAQSGAAFKSLHDHSKQGDQDRARTCSRADRRGLAGTLRGAGDGFDVDHRFAAYFGSATVAFRPRHPSPIAPRA
jgi:Resolvase, N terminal domain